MDHADLRASIPALERCAYFNTGASGPSPRPVVAAATEFLEDHAFAAPCGDGPYETAWDAVETARETVAGHLGAAPDEVALAHSTADAVTRVASAIEWEPGDAVVLTDVEHPAGRLPWQRLAELRDLEVRVVETERGRLDPDRIAAAAGDARLVVCSSITWTHGTRLPVADVADAAHDAGAKLLVDAVQSVGQHPIDVEEWGADFVAGAGHKWLLGPWGAGFLWVAPDALADLEPRRIGYRSVVDPGGEGGSDEEESVGAGNGSGGGVGEFHPGARRLEVGTRSPAPLVGLATAVETMEAVGLDRIESRVDRLSGRLAEGLGDRLVSPPDARSGLVTFDAEDPARTVDELAQAGYVCRRLPEPDAVRASVHAFNTAEEVDGLLDALA